MTPRPAKVLPDPSVPQVPLHVLLLEHDEADIELNVLELERGGFAVQADVARTRREFEERVSAARYDVVLADYRLSGWTGMDALSVLRSLGSDAPLIMVTGTLGEERAVECVNRGAADCIIKENLGRLPAAVRRALEARRLRAERERAVRTLRASEKQLRLLLHSTAEGIYGLDHAGRCTFCNPAAARMLGYASPDELLGKAMHPLVHHTRANGSRYPAATCPIHETMPRGQGTHVDDEVLWRADGSSFPVEYWAYPIREGPDVVGAVVTFLDVTRRRQAQVALAQSEAKFRALAEASFDAIVVSVNGVVREVNSGFVDTFGYDVEEALGHPVTEFVAEDSLELVRHRLENGLEGRYEIWGKHRDGSRILLETTAKTQLFNGQPGRITALRNITERRLLEEQYRQSQKLEAVGRLAGGVAHDFNNLLTVITGTTAMLLEDLPVNDSRRGDLEQIEAAAAGAAALTRQLLTFSRRQAAEPRVIVLEDVVRSTGKLLQRLIGEDITLSITPSPQPNYVCVDPGQLEQVIMNLAVNARDAMPKGGRFSLETSAVELDDAYARSQWGASPGRYALLTVRDTGIGMDVETKARVFEPFFTTKEAGKGTGLGLSIVYGIVKQSGGFVGVMTEPGCGTTFEVFWPLGDAEARAAAMGPPSPQRRGTETVLLAEDALPVRLVVKRILERCGYTVLEATTASAAIGFAARRDSRIQLLLTDVVMPEMSGPQLAEQCVLRQPGLKVLYMSGYADDAVVQRGVLGNRVAFLQKPFLPHAVAARVRAVLDAPAPPASATPPRMDWW